MRKLRQYFWLALLLTAAGVRLWNAYEADVANTADATPGQPSRSANSQPDQRASFQHLTGASLAEDRNNDGDSFRLAVNGSSYVFRIYFVDAPEKHLNRFNGERLDQQGRYFGHSDRNTTIQIGLEAKQVAERLLRSTPFTIHTRWQKVYDSGRFYAFIQFGDGEYLSEKLVKLGLCRIYTEGAETPDGQSRKGFEAKLRELEKAARKARRGGWR